MDPNDIARGILDGNTRAVARGISIVENDLPEKEGLIKLLFPHTGRAVRIGITGAPGSGKSTLVDRLIRHYRNLDKRVGVIAVDPSSPFTRGAILGDRLRMQDHSRDNGVFIRSMASRGHLGGLSSGCWDAVKIFDAAGFNPIIIETIGVGQTEVDIIKLSDLIMLLLVPGLGDEIQALKAGIMEIGDIYVINKKDLEGADKLKAEVEYALGSYNGSSGHNALEGGAHETAEGDDGVSSYQRRRPILMVSSKNNEGISELAAAIDTQINTYRDNGFFEKRRKNICEDELKKLISEKTMSLLDEYVVTADSLASWTYKILSRERDPYSIIHEYILPRLRLVK